MRTLLKLREKWQGLTDAVMRFPLTIILLIAAVVSNAIAIEASENTIYVKLLVTFIIGAMLFAVFQVIYERFFDNPLFRIIFMAVTIAAIIMYFIIIRNTDWEVEVTIRTIVILFILFVAFLWIPVMKSHNNFNESFMAVFKGFFITVLFNGVLFLGVALIIGATDLLIFNVDEDAYIHSANIIFVFMAPTYLFTLIPVFHCKKELAQMTIAGQTLKNEFVQDNQVTKNEVSSPEKAVIPGYDIKNREAFIKMTTPTKFLETLISYVIIPITGVFTVILLLYIIMNITGEFWTDSLMEPMLVSYSITVIIVYILASTIINPFAVTFRKIFPKVLIPVVLFQTLSSILRISDVGVTYGRYYVILFGIFATAAGVIFCIFPVRKNGLIAPVLIVLSIISILPPVDSFTLSKATQIARLENVLNRNNMISGDEIVPKADLSVEDQADIIKSLDYLNNMEYTKEIDYLNTYSESYDFEKTFGFSQYSEADQNYESYYFNRDLSEPIPVAGYDFMALMNVYSKSEDATIKSFDIEGKTYNLRLDHSMNDNQVILLEDENGQEMLRYEFNNLFTKFTGVGSGKAPMPTEELTFVQENDMATMAIVANSISYNEWNEGSDKSADLIIFINIK